MPPLGLATVSYTRGPVSLIDTVHLPVVAEAAEVEHPPAIVDDALDLPEIVHSRARPPGTRPPRGTRAITLASNASTRGDPGLGAGGSGPFFLVVVAEIVRRSPRQGQLRRQTALLRFPRFSVLVDTGT